MRIKQYVYFALFSRTSSGQELAERLSLPADEIVVMGSRRADPPKPARHAWRMVCREPGLRVDEQIAQVFDRLRPCRERVIEVAGELARDDPDHGGARLCVVRNLDHDEGEEELRSPPDAPLQRFAGQHQLLGWGIDAELMAFLLAANASFDVDEYG